MGGGGVLCWESQRKRVPGTLYGVLRNLFLAEEIRGIDYFCRTIVSQNRETDV